MPRTDAGRATEPLRSDMTIKDIVVVMSEGNPGAIHVMMAMITQGEDIANMTDLEDMNIRGAQIWIAFKDWAGGNLQKFIEGIRTRDQDMVDAVNREYHDLDNSLPKAVRFNGGHMDEAIRMLTRIHNVLLDPHEGIGHLDPPEHESVAERYFPDKLVEGEENAED